MEELAKRLDAAEKVNEAAVLEGNERSEKLQKEVTELRQQLGAEAEQRQKLETENRKLQGEVADLRKTVAAIPIPKANPEDGKVDKEVARIEEQLRSESRARRDLEALHNKVKGRSRYWAGR